MICLTWSQIRFLMKIKSLLTLLAVFVLSSACTQPNPYDLKLNDGERWEINKEMVKPIERAEAALAQFQEVKATHYDLLAEALWEQNNELIQSCTMEGEAHDELHKWLYPHMQLIDKLSKAEQLDEQKRLISELEESFELFHEYFK